MADIELPYRISGGGGRSRPVATPGAESVPTVRSTADRGVRVPGIRAPDAVVPSAPRVPSEAFGGSGDFEAAAKGLSDFGASLARVSEASVTAEREAAVSAATVRATADLKSFVMDLEQDPDFATYPERFKTKATEAFETYSQGLDERSKAKFRANFERLSLEQALNVRSMANKRVVDKATADLDTALDGYANIGAEAASPQERAEAVAQGRAAIQSAAQTGVINAETAGKRERAFLSRLDEVTARKLIAADPFSAAKVLGNSKILPNIDEKARVQLLETANRRVEAIERENTAKADRAERRAEREIRRQGDEAAKELDQLLADGVLTREAVDKKRGVLSPSEYRGFLKAVGPKEIDADDRDTIARIEPILGTPGADYQIDLAFATDKLKTETYRSLRNKNRELMKDDQPDSPYKTGREFLSVGLDPGQISNDPTVRQPLAIARVRALRDYDNWIAGNPNAVREDIQRKADEVLERYQNVAFGELRLALPRPYGFSGSKRDVTPDTVTEAAGKILQDQAAGKLSPTEAARELQNLDVWERASQPKTPAKPAGKK